MVRLLHQDTSCVGGIHYVFRIISDVREETSGTLIPKCPICIDGISITGIRKTSIWSL